MRKWFGRAKPLPPTADVDTVVSEIENQLQTVRMLTRRLAKIAQEGGVHDPHQQ